MNADAKKAVATIDVRMKDIRQLFNSLDATPFPDRDLDADAEEFIVGWAMELPSDAPLVLRVHVAQPPEDPRLTDGLQDAIRNYFVYRVGVIQRQFRQLLQRGRWSLLIGLACVAGSVTAANLIGRLGPGTLGSILTESLLIGGWVAMWRPLQIFLYDWWPLRHHRRVCERLSRAQVQLIIAGQERTIVTP
jgi:hypothetical protein